MDAIEKKGALLIINEVRAAEGAARGMDIVERLTDADMAEAEESRAAFEQAEGQTAPLRGSLDFWHALKWLQPTPEENRAIGALFDGAFGDPIRVGGNLREPDAPSEEAIELFEREGAEQPSLIAGVAASVRDYVALRGLLERAHALAREERFLHWQLAFPRIWRNWTSTEPEGGFDAVIGNPPCRGKAPARVFSRCRHTVQVLRLRRRWAGQAGHDRGVRFLSRRSARTRRSGRVRPQPGGLPRGQPEHRHGADLPLTPRCRADEGDL
jgi:hypothetical protein